MVREKQKKIDTLKTYLLTKSSKSSVSSTPSEFTHALGNQMLFGSRESLHSGELDRMAEEKRQLHEEIAQLRDLLRELREEREKERQEKENTIK